MKTLSKPHSVLHLDPPKVVSEWHAAYCRHYGTAPSPFVADQWFTIYGEFGQVVAVSGEEYVRARDTLRVLYLYAEPSREGVRAVYYILNTYKALVGYRVFSAIIGETLYANRSMRRWYERCGIQPYSIQYMIGTPLPKKVA